MALSASLTSGPNSSNSSDPVDPGGTGRTGDAYIQPRGCDRYMKPDEMQQLAKLLSNLPGI